MKPKDTAKENIQTCEYCNVVYCLDCDGGEHSTQIGGKCVSNTWEHKVIKQDDRYLMVESFGKDGYVELFDASSLENLEEQLLSDYKSMKEAIKRYGN